MNQTSPPTPPERRGYGLGAVMELFDIGPWVAFFVLSLSSLIFLAGVVFFIRSAPPSTLTISSGPEGSMYHRTALRYAKALKENGVEVKILTSKGSLENLKRISGAEEKVDLGFVQSGVIEEGTKVDSVVSLGVIANQPIFFFYRGRPIELLTEIQGKRIAIGQVGSGARIIALKILDLHGIRPEGAGTTRILEINSEDAAISLQNGSIDAAFITSENIAMSELRKLMRSKEIRLFNFKNAAAFTRRVDYLNVLELPQGVIDFGLNVPATDVSLVGPMIELIATDNLHPALSDLVLDAAMTIHGRPGLFQKRSEFPMPIQQILPISDDADRFYKSGKTFLYRHLPFWLASVTNRILLVFIPMAVILIPLIRSVPALFRWRSQIRIRKLYRELLRVEEKFKHDPDPSHLEALQVEFNRIDTSIARMRVPPAYADQFYSLRVHIDYVRRNARSYS